MVAWSLVPDDLVLLVHDWIPFSGLGRASRRYRALLRGRSVRCEAPATTRALLEASGTVGSRVQHLVLAGTAASAWPNGDTIERLIRALPSLRLFHWEASASFLTDALVLPALAALRDLPRLEFLALWWGHNRLVGCGPALVEAIHGLSHLQSASLVLAGNAIPLSEGVRVFLACLHAPLMQQVFVNANHLVFDSRIVGPACSQWLTGQCSAALSPVLDRVHVDFGDNHVSPALVTGLGQHLARARTMRTVVLQLERSYADGLSIGCCLQAVAPGLRRLVLQLDNCTSVAAIAHSLRGATAVHSLEPGDRLSFSLACGPTGPVAQCSGSDVARLGRSLRDAGGLRGRLLPPVALAPTRAALLQPARRPAPGVRVPVCESAFPSRCRGCARP